MNCDTSKDSRIQSPTRNEYKYICFTGRSTPKPGRKSIDGKKRKSQTMSISDLLINKLGATVVSKRSSLDAETETKVDKDMIDKVRPYNGLSKLLYESFSKR